MIISPPNRPQPLSATFSPHMLPIDSPNKISICRKPHTSCINSCKFHSHNLMGNCVTGGGNNTSSTPYQKIQILPCYIAYGIIIHYDLIFDDLIFKSCPIYLFIYLLEEEETAYSFPFLIMLLLKLKGKNVSLSSAFSCTQVQLLFKQKNNNKRGHD